MGYINAIDIVCDAVFDDISCRPKAIFFYVILACILGQTISLVYCGYVIYRHGWRTFYNLLFRRIDNCYIAQPIYMLQLSLTVPGTLKLLYSAWLLIGLPINRFCTDIIYGLMSTISFFLSVAAIVGLIAYIPPIFIYKSYEDDRQTRHQTDVDSRGNTTRTLFVPSIPILYRIGIVYGTLGSCLKMGLTIWVAYLDEHNQWETMEIPLTVYTIIDNCFNILLLPLLFYYSYKLYRIINIYVTCKEKYNRDLNTKTSVAKGFRNTFLVMATINILLPMYAIVTLIAKEYTAILWYYVIGVTLSLGFLCPLAQIIIAHDISEGVRAFKQGNPYSSNTDHSTKSTSPIQDNGENPRNANINPYLIDTSYFQIQLDDSLVWQSFGGVLSAHYSDSTITNNIIESFAEQR
ncbi:hypothetical protein BDF22DRAFT_740610 [Syncephalis plumigaleata]|nr:hypothetical protein BDF22DRAFT_740610 [Syncephalis plumigaleata]